MWDIDSVLISLPECEMRIETRRFGPFTFRLGVDGAALVGLHQRVLDAHERFIGSPLSQVARQLEREVVVSSIFGTNSIEGGTLINPEKLPAFHDPFAGGGSIPLEAQPLGLEATRLPTCCGAT